MSFSIVGSRTRSLQLDDLTLLKPLPVLKSGASCRTEDSRTSSMTKATSSWRQITISSQLVVSWLKYGNSKTIIAPRNFGKRRATGVSPQEISHSAGLVDDRRGDVELS